MVWAKETTATAQKQQIGYNYNGTAKANIDSNTLRDNGSVAGGLAVSNAKATNVIVDEKNTNTHTLDEKIYQDGGAIALQQKTADSDNTTLTYADGSTTVDNESNSSNVTLFNKGKAEKYREAVTVHSKENSWKEYQKDEDGDIILKGGKPVEKGIESKAETTKTTQNLYQIGQERKSDSVVVTDRTEKSTVDGSYDFTAKETKENIVYRKGQADGKATEDFTTKASNEIIVDAKATKTGIKESGNRAIVTYQKGQALSRVETTANSSEEQQTKADNTGYTYTTVNKTEDKDYNTR